MSEITAFSPRPSISALQLQIDKKLAALAYAARELKAQRNTTIPIARLPPEILCRIFLCVRDTQLHPYLKFIRAKHWYPRISHVCRTWRAVALACPRLWSTVEMFYGAEWAHEMFARSKSVPLKFSGDLSTANVHLLLSLIPHIARVRELHLRLATPPQCIEVDQFLAAISVDDIPLLDHLTITSRTTTPTVIPDCIFQSRSTPSDVCHLYYLELYNCTFSWTALSSLADLTTLKLSFSPNTEAPTHDILQALRALPQLHVLALALPLSAIPSPATDGPIPLPHLTSLHITDTTAHQCGALLALLVLPRTTALHLHFKCPTPSDNDVHSLLFPTLTTWSQTQTQTQTQNQNQDQNQNQTPTTLECTHQGEDDIIIRLFPPLDLPLSSSQNPTPTPTPFPFPLPTPPLLEIRISTPYPRYVYSLLRVLPLASLTTLRVLASFQVMFASPSVMCAFWALKELGTVCVSGEDALRGVVGALGVALGGGGDGDGEDEDEDEDENADEDADENEDEALDEGDGDDDEDEEDDEHHEDEADRDTHAYVFPALTTLHIANCNFREADLLEQLTDALRERREHGCGVQTLRLRACYSLGEPALAALREVVGGVEVMEV